MKKTLLAMGVCVSVLSGCANLQEIKDSALKALPKPQSMQQQSQAQNQTFAQPQQEQEQSVVATIQAVRNFKGTRAQLDGDDKSIKGMLNSAMGKKDTKKDDLIAMQEIFVLMPNGKTVSFKVESQNFKPGMDVRITLRGRKAEVKAI